MRFIIRLLEKSRTFSSIKSLTIFIYVFNLYLRAFVLVSIASLISRTWVIVSATVCSRRGRGSNKVSWRIISIFSLLIESNHLIFCCYSIVNVCLSFMRLLSVLNVSFLSIFSLLKGIESFTTFYSYDVFELLYRKTIAAYFFSPSLFVLKKKNLKKIKFKNRKD